MGEKPPNADIFDPNDVRSSDDITRNILEMLDLDENKIKEMRAVNTVFASGAEDLLPIRIKGGSIADAIRRYRLVRAKGPQQVIIIIPDTDHYKIGRGVINGNIYRNYSHKRVLDTTSSYTALDYLPQDLTNLKIITPELEVTCDGPSYDVKWLIDEVPVACFSSCERLRNFTFPSTLKRIRGYAFAACTLSNVDLEHTQLQIIEEQAFHRSGLVSVSFPPSLGTIGLRAFNACLNLRHVRFAEGSQTELRNYAFSSCMRSDMEIHFPESGKIVIGYRSFGNCGLLTVHITPGVFRVYRQAFRDCQALVSVTIDARVPSDAVLFDAFPIWTQVEHMGRCDFGSCVLQLRF